MGKFKDLTGLSFNKWTVISRAENKGKHIMWNCVCTCGNKRAVNATSLTSGRSRSCGCWQKDEPNRFVDLGGKRFGNLLVLSREPDRGKMVMYKCRCDCGNEVVVSQAHLSSGHTKSCGHLKHNSNNFRDLTGERFGSLVAMNVVKVQDNRRTFWKCKCDCGNETAVEQSYLVSGHTGSCGCSNVSNPELEIKSFIESISGKEFKKVKILDGKEIDMYNDELKIGIEYNGSAYHATENGTYSDKDKYYHRDKFLLAKSKGIYLITVFDIDYKTKKWEILEKIKSILLGNTKIFIPDSEIVYTNNDYDNGNWLKEYGYVEIGQEEPESFIYNDFVVYRCGKTKWKLFV